MKITEQREQMPPLGAKIEGRRHGLDLIRVLAMFMVCVLHMNWMLGGMGELFGRGTVYMWGLGSWEAASIIAVNMFGMLTGYLCVNKPWKLNRYFRLWIWAAFYTVGLYALAAPISQWLGVELEPVSMRTWCKACVPVPLASSTNYFTAYTALVLLIPFINPLLTSLSRGRYAAFLGVIVLLSVLYYNSFGIYWNTPWLVLLYVIGGYFRLHPANVPRCLLLVGYAGCIVWICGYSYVMGYMLMRNSCLPILLGSICVFLFCCNLHMRVRISAAVISKLAPYAFAVYLIHMHPVMIQTLLQLLKPIGERFDYAWWLFIVAPTTLYLGCTLIDVCRAGLFKLCRADAFADAMERWLLRLWKSSESLLNKRFAAWFTSDAKQ